MPAIVIDSKENEQVAANCGYLSDVKEIVPVAVELENGTNATATKLDTAEIDVRGEAHWNARYNAYPKLNSIHCPVTGWTNTALQQRLNGNSKSLDRYDGSRVLGKLQKGKHDGLFAGRILVPERNWTELHQNGE